MRFTSNEITKIKSKMVPKPSERAHAKKAKSAPSKSSVRNRTKKSEGISFKDKIGYPTNIPLSATLMKSKSCEKSVKTDGSKKTVDFIDKNKNIRSKSATEKTKMSCKDRDKDKDKEKEREKSKEPQLGILEKVALVSKNNHLTPKKSKTKNEPLLSPGEEKLKVKGFTQLLPLCEKELKKIEETWLNSVYCSLSMRANLFKFLSESFPNVEKSQFYTEDKKLLQQFDHVKLTTKTETENLLELVKSLMAARDKTRDEYHSLLRNDRDLKKKLTPTGKKSQEAKPELLATPQRKDASEATEADKSKTDNPPKKKDLSFMSFFSFGSHNGSKQAETTPKANPPKPPEEEKPNDGKPEVSKLLTLQKDFEALKAKYTSENEFYEKKIKDLEIILEEKIRILKQEKEVKAQLQTYLSQFQAQQKRLSKTFGCEQLDYLLGPSTNSREKRREELWLTAIKLILKGFFIQLKNLEVEKNKMLFQLQSNDAENFNALAASIIQKENFIKSIKQQMKSFNKAYQKRKNK